MITRFPLGRIIAIALAAAPLMSCSPPQDMADVNQVVAGADKTDALFAVQMVNGVTLPTVLKWPDVQTLPSDGWIAHQSVPSDPVIQPGDKLSLSIWDNDETSLLSQPSQKVIQLPDLKVSSRGTLLLPYIQEIYVAKMTPDEARQAIQDKIVAIIPSAQVQVNYASGAKNTVEVVAGMSTNGPIPLPQRDVTVTQILAQAGGIPEALTNPQVNLQRDGKLYRVSAKTLLADPSLDTVVRGGDRIYVQPDDRYFLSLGAAGKEALINFPRDGITALDAMSIIGGVNPGTANPRSVLILRNYAASAVTLNPQKGPPKQQVVFAFDLTNADGLFAARAFPILNKDLVLVTQSPLVNTRTVVNIFTGLIAAGRNTVNTFN